MKKRIKNIIESYLLENSTNGIVAYHGSDYFFLKFSKEKLDKSLNFGFGFYFADNQINASKYGKYIYEVILFENKKDYVLLDIKKQIEFDLLYKIISSLYIKLKKPNLDYNVFEYLYNIEEEFIDLKEKIWNKLLNLDDNLNMLTFDEIIDNNNKNTWYHISNFLKKNKELNDLYNKYSFTKNNIENKNIFNFNFRDNGYLIYKKIANLLGGDEKASMFLLENGIDGNISEENGIKYYCIFDEKNITIINTKKNKPYNLSREYYKEFIK